MKTIYFIKDNIISILLVMVFYWILFFNPYVANADVYGSNYYFYHIFILAIAIFVAFRHFIFFPKLILVGNIDFLFSLYIIYILISSSVFNGVAITDEGILNFSLVTLIYYINRSTNSNSLFLLLFICLSCFPELYILIRQVIDHETISGDNAKLFLFTNGTLGNSALEAAYLIALLPMIIYFCNYINRQVIRKILITLFLLLVIGIIFITQSRATLVSFIGITFIVIAKKTNLISFYHRFRYKYIIMVSTIISCILIAFFLVNLKFNSAAGRSLVWYISAENFPKHLFLGVGYGNFQVRYMNWQADFFFNHNNIPLYSMLADIVDTPFNELLQILIETGIIGLLLFLSIFYSAIRIRIDQNDRNNVLPYIQLSLISIILFSLFSYPLHSTPILVLFVLLISILAKNDKKLSINIGRPMRVMTFIILLLLAFSINFCVGEINALKKWNAVESDIEYNNNTINNFSSCYPWLKNNGLFLYDYGVMLFYNKKYNEAIKIFERCKTKRIVLDTYLYEGLAYEQIHNYEKAIGNYLTISAMVPNRFRPKYYLAKAYLLAGDTLDACITAKKIIQMPVKIPSAEVENIQQEMQRLIISNQQLQKH